MFMGLWDLNAFQEQNAYCLLDAFFSRKQLILQKINLLALSACDFAPQSSECTVWEMTCMRKINIRGGE